MPKKQIRRCANCQKVGHNKSTCTTPTATQTVSPKTPPPPLKFFIHHVTHEPTASPHVINLKREQDSLWNQVETVSPEPDNALYQHYHETRPSPLVSPPKATPAPSRLFQKIKHLHNAIKELRPWFHKITSFPRQLIPTKGLAAVAVLLVFLIIIPGPARSYYNQLESIKNTVANEGLAGFSALQDSAAALREADLNKASSATRRALATFDQSLNIVGQHSILTTLARAMPLVGGEVESRENILLAGQEIAVGNSYLLYGLSIIPKSPSSTLLQQIDTTLAYVNSALPNYQKALKHLQLVKVNNLPLEYQSQFLGYRDLFGHLVNDFESLADLGGAIHEIFGGKGLRRYLLVFQNESELRPTGGFMGSFAIIDVKDGAIVNLEVPPGGTYDVQGQLREFIKPPAPLLLSNKRWEFQDANWFPDFPTSAEKIMWFYAHSRGVSTDGVIAINSSVLRRILTILGPLTDEKRQLTLNADNALPTIQQIVEEGPEKKLNRPKQILTDLAPELLGALHHVPTDKILALLTNASEALKQKEIQAYFTDSQTEGTLRSFGWTGQILDTPANIDYLFVVNTNIQGQKSDAKIHQTISHQAVAASDGSIIDNVVITREHSGNRGDMLYGQTNTDFLRLYVPKGSTLLSAGGFTWPEEKNFQVPDAWTTDDPFLNAHQTEIGVDQTSGTAITEESGKTVFGNWVITEPGQVSQVQFTYRLPFTLFSATSDATLSGWQKMLSPLSAPLARYQLVVQKQSGLTADFESQIVFPANWRPEWKDGAALKTAKNGATIEKKPLTADSVWSLLMKKQSN
ncbi:MAG: DUF4012 domain-containing protein [Candidatus Magasanikbacteria bacterium]|nr:DUF4012 domain-containing protein [Candidatus Magasanikbacteria bacterium]